MFVYTRLYRYPGGGAVVLTHFGRDPDPRVQQAAPRPSWRRRDR